MLLACGDDFFNESRILWPDLRMCSGFSCHFSVTCGNIFIIPSLPYLVCLGIYVAAKIGIASGVMMMLKGQPPLPVNFWQTSMYTLSISGRSSRSTLIAM